MTPQEQEKIARALHAAYRHNENADRIAEAGIGMAHVDKQADASWEAVPETYRMATLAHAASMADALDTVGIEIVDAKRGDAKLTEDEHEALAQREHERWLRERKTSGWVYGPERDDEQLVHPLIVPWESLSVHDQNIDRSLVDAWPRVLQAAGLGLRRRQ